MALVQSIMVDFLNNEGKNAIILICVPDEMREKAKAFIDELVAAGAKLERVA